MNDISSFNNKNLYKDLKKSYIDACKDPMFVKLVTKLKLKEEVAMKYTSKLERCVSELKNCKDCKGLACCKNPSCGYLLYPRVDDERVQFDAVACKYLQEQLKIEENSSVMYYQPHSIKTASMKDIDKNDKKRLDAIKWIVKFYKDYDKDNHIKGLYLHGSFGSGKTYILAALFNELAKKNKKCIICYYPEMLRKLKESFGSTFEYDMNELKTCDLLLIDDIGAESVTSWSRDEILSTILQYRMDEKLPTFFTSNLNISELEAHLSETKDSIDKVKARRIIERIKQLTDDIEIISVNRRQ
ncbi:MAG: primosomal protein DnaI [Bacilli bacterium]|nr:primosomal protein DnaI [Bacilli bacterium]